MVDVCCLYEMRWKVQDVRDREKNIYVVGVYGDKVAESNFRYR